MRTINHKIKPVITILIYIIIMIIAALFFSGCNIEKQNTRKDIAAVNRVNANANLQTPVVNSWLLAHPQDTSTKIITLPPTIIKVPVIQLQRDLSIEKKIKDSLIAVGKDCGEAAINAYDLGYDEAELYYKNNPITVTCPPSTKETKVDYSAISRAMDSLRQKEKEISYIKGVRDSVTESLGEEKKSNTKLWWLVIGISVAALLSHIARSYIPSIKLPI